MAPRDPRIDAYIAKSAEFARPILERLRAVVHAACPEVEETMKWSMPHFDYRGEMMCAMAAFKGHAVFGFWKRTLVLGTNAGSRDAMGSFGRITSIKALPAKKVLVGYIRKAMALNDAGIKVTRAVRRPRAEAVVSADLASALRRTKGALRSGGPWPPAIAANTCNGCRAPSRTRRGRAASPRPSARWCRGSRRTGATCPARRRRRGGRGPRPARSMLRRTPGARAPTSA